MFTTAALARTLASRLTPMLVAGLLVLSLMLGAGGAIRVSAAAPPSGPVIGSTQTTGPYAPADDDTIAAKKGGKPAPKRHTYCLVLDDPETFYSLTGIHSDVGGTYCYKA